MHLVQLSIGLVLAVAATASNHPLLVELEHGELRGRDNGLYYSYESIPYAEPPVGALCLADPVPYSQRWESTFDASRPPAECLQWNELNPLPDKLTGSEDCLTVSVYRPRNTSRIDYPVVAHIFGAGWSFGNALDDGVEYFMRRGEVIVVKINYRLGALGFLSTGDEVIPGNFGLKDQHLAIQWIKRNIARFGGDPGRIILMGLGTGGSSVHLQLMHKDMEKVVKGAISVSGTALSPFAVQRSGRDLAFSYGKILGCVDPRSSHELRACLLQARAADIVRAVTHIQVLDFAPFGPFTPVLESIEAKKPFLTEMPLELIKSGRSAQVPWLASYTSENGNYNAAVLLQKDPNGTEKIEELNDRWDELAPHFLSYPHIWNQQQMDRRSSALKMQYLGRKPFSVQHFFPLQRMFTNRLYVKGVETALNAHRTYGNSPVYAYVYDNPADRSYTQFLAKREDLFLGTGMGDDFHLMFSNPIRGPLRPDEKLISWHFVRMIEQFAANETLVYDNCVFPDNRGMRLFQLVVIRRTHCELLEQASMPRRISNRLPQHPVVVY